VDDGAAVCHLVPPYSHTTHDALALPVLGPVVGYGPLLHALRTGLGTYTLSLSAIRREPPIGRAAALSRDGGNVGDLLKRIEKHEEDLAWIVKHLAAITPGITGIRAVAHAGQRIVLYFQSADGAKLARFAIGDMSDGTLRSLAILLALRQKPAPALVCIDGIEDSIHPSALAVLLDAVAASTERCQVLLTSQSPEALSHEAVTAKRVRVVDWNAGRSDVFRLSQGTEEIARPPRSNGELLRANALFTEREPERAPEDFFEAG
jgi:predicted ATPase